MWKWDVNVKMMVIEVITFCLTGYSVQSWSRPQKGTGLLLLEGKQRALMSRLWGHSEYSDPSDWSLEYRVSKESYGSKKEEWKREKQEHKWCSGDQVWMVIGCGGGVEWTRDWSSYWCLTPHMMTHIYSHPVFFLPRCQKCRDFQSWTIYVHACLWRHS